jgi:hypothetical protein
MTAPDFSLRQSEGHSRQSRDCAGFAKLMRNLCWWAHHADNIHNLKTFFLAILD